jgi:arylsulfatase A-like enzyme
VGGVTDPDRSRSVTAPTFAPPAAFRPQAFAESMPAGWQALEGDNRRIWMVREQGWKLILNWNPDTQEQRWELYDLRQDPGELTNVHETESEPAGRLKDMLLQHMAHRLG